MYITLNENTTHPFWEFTKTPHLAQKEENEKEEHSVTANTTFSAALCLQKFESHSYF